MSNKKRLNLKGMSYFYNKLIALLNFLIGTSSYNEEETNTERNGVPDKSIMFSYEVLDDFRKNVGKYRAETGGLLASSKEESLIDRCHFDTLSQNSPGTFYYDVNSMTEVFRSWKAQGYVTNGIYHSHPKGVTAPSYHDISSALLHIEFFGLDYFYLPIFQPEHNGLYTMYFYVVRKIGDELKVTLHYVIKAVEDSYKLIPFTAWNRSYPIAQLKDYRESVDSEPRKKTSEADSSYKHHYVSNRIECPSTQTVPAVTSRECFAKVSSIYPDHVLDKVIICIGTGGARSFLENCARCGFRNFVLIDADIVSPSNVATQGVFVSEIGKKKVEVIRNRIKDINPEARVICVDRFLDDSMSDEEFKGYMDRFPGREPKDYLILGCTDNFEAQKRSSLLALKYGTPYLAAMLYERGAAAEIIFVYPGVTESCPRCLLRSRFEKYENGFVNDVDSSACPIFATERMNSLKGYIALMLMMYNEEPGNPFSSMLDEVKNRNFVEIRLDPHLSTSNLGIGLFDRVFSDASRFVYFDETIWIPQKPDRPEFGSEPCKLCGGTGDLTRLQYEWKYTDTRRIRFTEAAPAIIEYGT